MQMVVAMRVVIALLVAVVRVRIASTAMRVAPKGKFFKYEKSEDAAQQKREQPVWREAALQCFRQQLQGGCCEQQSGRETYREGEVLAWQAEHHQCRSGDAEQAAEQAGQNDLNEQRGLHGWAGRRYFATNRQALLDHSGLINATLLHLTAFYCFFQ
jgi:hypothetical protein